MITVYEGQLRLVICDDVRIEELSPVNDGVRRQRERCGDKLYYIAVIPEEAPMPDHATRAAMSLGLREIHDHCTYAGLVFCGHGLKARAKRALFAGMMLMIGKGKWHVGASVDELVRKSGNDLHCIAELRLAASLAAEKGYRI